MTMSQGFPKLLVATEFPPNIPGGGGAIVRQMLKDWPTDKLYWWSCQPDIHKVYGQRVNIHEVAVLPPRLYPYLRLRSLKCLLLEKFWVPWAAQHFRKTLASIQPDVVWTIPHCWSIPPMANVLLGANVPYHTSIYDYADIADAVAVFGPERCRRLTNQMDQLYARATTRDCVSQEMSSDLQARTGADGAINRTGLEPEDFTALQALAPVPADTIRIAYAGTLAVEREFAMFVSVLEKVRPKLTRILSLEFFGDHSYRDRQWFNPEWMKEHGNLSKPALVEALKNFTWGFSPMRLTDDDPRYNHFSLPTKFVSYLAVGLPIIVVGHPESTVMRMAAKYDVGLRITDDNPEKLQRELLAALSEPNPKMKYHSEIQRCASAEFDAPQMRSVLWENFRKSASNSR
jgi:hypothetical protein